MDWVLGIVVALGAFVVIRSAAAARPGGGVSVGVEVDEITRRRVERWRYAVQAAIAYHSAYVKPSLVLALIAKESGGVEGAVGNDDDRGLMQLTLPAWTDYVNLSGDPSPPGFNDMQHAEPNARVGVWFLQHSIDAMGSTRDGLRAYNRGVGGAREDPTAGAAYADWILAVEPSFRAVPA